MRILVLCGDHRSARSDMMANHGPDVKIREATMTVMKDESFVHYVAVRDARDADRLRGMRFDLIIEDGSFNPMRNWDKGDLLNMIRATVLR